jgi:hypothetical protein
VEERKKYIEERQNIIKIRPGHELEIETKAEEVFQYYLSFINFIKIPA